MSRPWDSNNGFKPGDQTLGSQVRTKTWLGFEYRFPTKQPIRPRADARARLHARERHRTRAHARGSGSTFTRHSLRLSVSRAIRRAEPAFRLTGGHIREGSRNETRVGHADFGASRSRRHRDLCACVVRGAIGVRTPLRGVASRGS